MDDINSLKDLGWIEVADNVIQMHPLIQETMYQLEWTEDYRTVALTELKTLFKQIKLNGKCEDYPKKLYERNKKIKQNMKKADAAEKIVTKMLEKKGVVGEVVLDRIMRGDAETLDSRHFYHVLNISKSVLDTCIRDSILSEEKLFKDLLFVTLVNLPRDQENYIIHNADNLFEDKACQNPYAIMELYDYVIYLLCQKEDYEQAREYLVRAKSFAATWKNDYVWGLYYDMQNDFYEALLDGAYYTQDEDEAHVLNLLIESSDKAIKHMKKSKHESAKLYYAKYTLGKAALLIRSDPEHNKEIRKLINLAIPVIDKNALDYAEVRSVLQMVCAWYYTLCELDEDRIVFHLQKAKDIDEHRKVSELDRIDYYYIPAANMMCEIEWSDYTIQFLEEAYLICDAHKDSPPYMRKKLDLLWYQLEVFYGEQDMDNCRRILRCIDVVNEEVMEYGIVLEISDEVRMKVLG